jgi:DNA-binding GntR family transcriptional regulator
VLRQALAEHYRILEALERRDPKAAATEMIAHIQEWQAYFVNQFRQNRS